MDNTPDIGSPEWRLWIMGRLAEIVRGHPVDSDVAAIVGRNGSLTRTKIDEMITANDVELKASIAAAVEAQLDGVQSEAHRYADTRDTLTLAEAKKYTDDHSGGGGVSATYVDAGDAKALADAKAAITAAVSASSTTLRQYTDSAASKALTDAKTSAGAADTEILRLAKVYTDSKPVGGGGVTETQLNNAVAQGVEDAGTAATLADQTLAGELRTYANEAVSGSLSDAAAEAQRLATAAGAAAVATAGEYTDIVAETTSSNILAAVDVKIGGANKVKNNQRVGGIGDSIMQGGDSYHSARPFWGGSIWSILAIASNQRFNFVENAGVGGQTTGQILSRFVADIVEKNVGIVVIVGGTNDRNGGTMTLNQTKANLVAMVKLAIQNGIIPVLSTVPPTNIAGNGAFSTVALNRAGVNDLNAWIRAWCAKYGVAIMDIHKYLVDPANSGFKTSLTDDGTHPNVEGIKTVVTGLLTSLPSIFKGVATLANTNENGTNQFNNPLATIDANIDNIPDLWYFPNFEQISVSDAAVGKWITVNRVNGAGGTAYATTQTKPVSVGDVIAFSGKIKKTANVTATVSLLNNANFGAVATPIGNVKQEIVDGTYYMEYVVEAGVTEFILMLQANGDNGSVSISQPFVTNLSKLGVDNADYAV